MTRRDEDRSGTVLLLALAGSVLFHVLLLLASWLLPLGTFASRAEPPEERIHFTFAPPAERDSPGPVSQPLRPAPSPVETPPAQPAPQPSVPRPAVPERAPAQPPARAETVEPRRDEAEPQPQGAVFELPERDLSDPLREDTPGARTSGERVERAVERPIDIRQALRQFDDALTRAREREPRPATPSGGAPQHVFVPDFSALPTTGYGVGNLEFSSRDYDWSDYGRQIYIAIWRAWHNRLWMTTDEFERWAHRRQDWELEHANGIQFTILRSGEVTGITVLRGSDCPPLDLSATDALAEVVLPPLPADFPRDRETVRAAFIAQGDIRSMRRFLNWAKQRGLF